MSYYFEPGMRLNAPPAVAGDLVVGRADGNFNRLAIGANGTFLNVSAGAIRWGNTIDAGGLIITAGNLRLPNNAFLNFRNPGGTADVGAIQFDGSSNLILGENSVNFGTAIRFAIPTGSRVDFLNDNLNDIGTSGANRPRTAYFGTAIAVGTNPAALGTVRLANAAQINARNAGNTADVGLLYLDAIANANVGDGGANMADVRLNYPAGNAVDFRGATTALGGGLAPTFGTIGASGPAIAGQDSWLAIKIAGTTSFIPIWR